MTIEIGASGTPAATGGRKKGARGAKLAAKTAKAAAPDLHQGSKTAFDANWRGRQEAQYNHWTRGEPRNQIQLAFRSHWKLFRELLKDNPGRDCLEVGCGRGSLSSYFADNGYRCTLLDYSQSVLDTAQAIFQANGHDAKFVQGDANALPFKDASFDVVASIGLLEHFEDVRTPLAEQARILRPGGTFLGYIVPERPENVQKYFRWLNRGLKAVAGGVAAVEGVGARLGVAGLAARKTKPPKTEIFRSDYGSPRYLEALEGLPVRDVQVMGMYPLPMVSHSPEFPFSLLPKPVEAGLTRVFEGVLEARRVAFRRNPWVCREELGQAFLVKFTKA